MCVVGGCVIARVGRSGWAGVAPSGGALAPALLAQKMPLAGAPGRPPRHLLCSRIEVAVAPELRYEPGDRDGRDHAAGEEVG